MYSAIIALTLGRNYSAILTIVAATIVAIAMNVQAQVAPVAEGPWGGKTNGSGR
jgi:hypothetical protein